MVWDPQKYKAPVTKFYIAKGIGPDPDNQNVAYAVEVDFNTSTQGASVTLGIGQVSPTGDGSPCFVFTVESVGVETRIIQDGQPVAGTELPARCQVQASSS